MSKAAANGQAQYTSGYTDTCRCHDDESCPKHGDQLVVSAEMRPYAEYHSNVLRRPMDTQHCDHVTPTPGTTTNGCAVLTEDSNRNSYG